MKLEIDVTDWHESTMRDEIDVQSDADIIDLAETTSTAKLAKAAIVNRQLGRVNAENFTVRHDKLNLLFGTMNNIGGIIKSAKREAKTATGTTEIPAHIGKPGAKPGSDAQITLTDEQPETYVKVGSVTAAARARFYLTRNIPTEIRNMLFVLRESGGDYKQAAQDLKNAIDAMLVELDVSGK